MARVTLLLLLACFALPAQALKVDVHAHAELADLTGKTPEQLTDAMLARTLDKVILMTTPSALPGLSVYDTDAIASFFSDEIAAGKIHLMYGGDELNYLIHSIGRQGSVPGEHRWDVDDHADSVFPNSCEGGCSTAVEDAAAAAATLETDEETTGASYATFIERAQDAADSGLYLGFGEIGALHLSRRVGHPYISFPANHAWLMDLAEIAGEAGMVIDLHYEVSDANKGDLTELLEANEGTKFILEHGGWSTDGTTNGHAILRELIEANTNLYVALKKCDPDGIASCYHNASLAVSAEWADLILEYPHRFMFGSDAKYWQDSTYTVQQTMDLAFKDRNLTDGIGQGSLRVLRNYIRGESASAAEWLEGGTANSVFGFTKSGRAACGGSKICRSGKKLVPWAWRKAVR